MCALMGAAILFAWQDRNGFCIGDELLHKIRDSCMVEWPPKQRNPLYGITGHVFHDRRMDWRGEAAS
jgi:hypothetical protein